MHKNNKTVHILEHTNILTWPLNHRKETALYKWQQAWVLVSQMWHFSAFPDDSCFKSRALMLIHYFFFPHLFIYLLIADLVWLLLGIRLAEKQILEEIKPCSPLCGSLKLGFSTAVRIWNHIPVCTPNPQQLGINPLLPPGITSFAFHSPLVISSQGWQGPQCLKSLQRTSPAQRWGAVAELGMEKLSSAHQDKQRAPFPGMSVHTFHHQ